MKQDMIVILDLGSEENPKIAREIRKLGVYTEIHAHDITADELLNGIEKKRESKTQEAKDLICALLAGGKEVLSEEIDRAAVAKGISPRTVRDAKKELGAALKSKTGEGRKKVFWME